MPAVNRLMQIALLDVGRQTGARTAALNITNDDRDLGHRSPADRFGLERNAGPSAAGNGEISRIRKAERQRHGAKLVFSLHEYSAVLWKLAPEYFHNRRPGRDRITGAIAHARGDQSVSDRLIAIHRDLGASPGFDDMLKLIAFRQHIADGIGVASRKRHDGRVDDALVFAGELFFYQLLQLLDIETENFHDQAEDENVCA